MTIEDKNTETVSKEDFKALQEKLAQVEADKEKLAKIFDERQTKALKKEDVLKKDEILKALGIEKTPDKEPLDLINEKLSGFSKTIEDLNEKLSNSEKEKELIAKRSKAEKIAQGLNFNDVDDALRFVDLNSETIADDLKKLTEIKPYLIKQVQKQVGNTFNGGQHQTADLDKEIQDELRKFVV